MSESHTDELESERSEALRRSIRQSSTNDTDTTAEVPRAQWLAKRTKRTQPVDASGDDSRETRPPEADTGSSNPHSRAKTAKNSPGSGVISLPRPPAQKSDEFRSQKRQTSPRSTIVELAAQRLADYLPRGSYRVLTGRTIYDAVTPSELARLICRGAIVGVDKIMLDDGPWHPTSKHPALSRIRALFGTDLRAVLD
jgi:hypothetical protein